MAIGLQKLMERRKSEIWEQRCRCGGIGERSRYGPRPMDVAYDPFGRLIISSGVHVYLP